MLTWRPLKRMRHALRIGSPRLMGDIILLLEQLRRRGEERYALGMGREVRRERRAKRRWMTRGAGRPAVGERRWRPTVLQGLGGERRVGDVERVAVVFACVARAFEGRGVMRWTVDGLRGLLVLGLLVLLLLLLLVLVCVLLLLLAGVSAGAVVGGGVVEQGGDVHGVGGVSSVGEGKRAEAR